MPAFAVIGMSSNQAVWIKSIDPKSARPKLHIAYRFRRVFLKMYCMARYSCFDKKILVPIVAIDFYGCRNRQFSFFIDWPFVTQWYKVENLKISRILNSDSMGCHRLARNNKTALLYNLKRHRAFMTRSISLLLVCMATLMDTF